MSSLVRLSYWRICVLKLNACDEFRGNEMSSELIGFEFTLRGPVLTQWRTVMGWEEMAHFTVSWSIKVRMLIMAAANIYPPLAKLQPLFQEPFMNSLLTTFEVQYSLLSLWFLTQPWPAQTSQPSCQSHSDPAERAARCKACTSESFSWLRFYWIQILQNIKWPGI